MGLVLLVSVGCQSTGSNRTGTRAAESGASRLAQRCEYYWNARAGEDWKSAFDYYEPTTRAKLVREDYEKWSAENEPFRIHSFRIENVQVDGDVGWALVHYASTIRRFPDLPPREASMWQKWRRTQGDWYPIPVDELQAYPDPPALRDKAQEMRLRDRFEKTASLRKASNWSELYRFTDPADRADVTEDMYVEGESAFAYLDYRVHWVEAIDGFGRVCVTYRHRVTDKSMEKLPPRDLSVIEKWVRSDADGEWYRDLKR